MAHHLLCGFACLAWILIFYFIHVMVWTVSTGYRCLHGNAGRQVVPFADGPPGAQHDQGRWDIIPEQAEHHLHAVLPQPDPVWARPGARRTASPGLQLPGLWQQGACRVSGQPPQGQQGLTPRCGRSGGHSNLHYFMGSSSSSDGGSSSQPGSPETGNNSDRDTMSLQYEMLQQRGQQLARASDWTRVTAPRNLHRVQLQRGEPKLWHCTCSLCITSQSHWCCHQWREQRVVGARIKGKYVHASKHLHRHSDFWHDCSGGKSRGAYLNSWTQTQLPSKTWSDKPTKCY